MKSNVIDFSARKQQGLKNLKKNTPPSSETVRLWQLSLAVDELIIASITKDKLSPDEIATVLAHRLGTLIQSTEKPDELTKFCESIMERLNKSS